MFPGNPNYRTITPCYSPLDADQYKYKSQQKHQEENPPEAKSDWCSMRDSRFQQRLKEMEQHEQFSLFAAEHSPFYRSAQRVPDSKTKELAQEISQVFKDGIGEPIDEDTHHIVELLKQLNPKPEPDPAEQKGIRLVRKTIQDKILDGTIPPMPKKKEEPKEEPFVKRQIPPPIPKDDPLEYGIRKYGHRTWGGPRYNNGPSRYGPPRYQK